MAEAAQTQALASLKGSLKSGAYSDLTIKCGSDMYKVHKVIVCERAEFFARAIKFGGQESESGTVDLPKDEPAIVKLLIQYLYEGEYEPLLLDGESSLAPASAKVNDTRPKHNHNGLAYSYDFPHTCDTNNICSSSFVCPHHTCHHTNWSLCCANRKYTCEMCNRAAPSLPSLNGQADQLLLHSKIYEYADKYDVIGLKDLAIEKFSRSCKHFWDKDEFSIAAHHVFSTTVDTDKGLRDIVSATIGAHMGLVKKPEVKVLMTEFNGLALGILEEKIVEHGW
ncbi:uncharacterized protein J4E78_005770 [Alternaria triticimaculans]|uniref:uncharacterized protein n=1 Tax=Alternaria triticimaculans TaxID=297637 RepID=UPI0020C266CB|nr:uncharacterized protein J4E78_005770 [Alternaria triticimaculans]KAI4659343.1 hypothetical protein J4E78_005770 [Alternaria triticimaculans]